MTPLALLAAAAWACPSHPAMVQDDIATAERSYEALDLPGFQRARDRARADLACVDEVIDPHLAAQVHILSGLDRYLDDRQDIIGITAAFRAARLAWPQARLPPAVAPPGHPLDAMFNAATASSASPTGPVLAPPGATIWIDGALSTARPLERPTVVQLVSTVNQRVLWSGWLDANQPPPSWGNLDIPAPTFQVRARDTASPYAQTTTRSGPRPAWLAASGLALVTAGTMYGFAWRMSSRYDDPATTRDRAELDALRKQTNTLVLGSAGIAGLGLSAGIVAWSADSRCMLNWRTTW